MEGITFPRLSRPVSTTLPNTLMNLSVFAGLGLISAAVVWRQRRKNEKRHLSIFDWNILAPMWIDLNDYRDIDGDLNLLHEGKRLLLVIHRILQSDADIITLQEVQEDQYEILCSELGHKYESIGLVDHAITYWTTEWLQEGVQTKKNGQATFLRKDKFQVISKKRIQTTEDGNMVEIVGIEPAMDFRDRICNVTPPWTLILVNCHLESGMKDWKHIARSKQVIKIHQEVESLSSEFLIAGRPKPHVIITGDFNTYQDQLGMKEVRTQGYVDVAEVVEDVKPTFIVVMPYEKMEIQLDHVVIPKADLTERVEIRKFNIPDVSSPEYDAIRHKETILEALSDLIRRRGMSWTQALKDPKLFDIVTHIPPSKDDFTESNALKALRIGSDHLPLYIELVLK